MVIQECVQIVDPSSVLNMSVASNSLVRLLELIGLNSNRQWGTWFN